MKKPVALSLALLLLACSSNAVFTGTVTDAATEAALDGTPIQAERADPELTVRTSTRPDGQFKLSLPAGEWTVTVNPSAGKDYKSDYLPLIIPLTAAPKEKRALDTAWLAPRPPDSQAGTGYLLVRGKGYITLPLVDTRHFPQGELVLYQKDPLFYAAARPLALVTYGPTRSLLLGAGSGTYVSEGMTRYWKFPVEPVPGARDYAADGWRVSVWPGALTPGRYAAFLPRAEAGDYTEGAACLFAVPAPGE
jgi:hypothetical protein